MFRNNDERNNNRIIDGDFIVDRYITVSINGQIHSRKVKDGNGIPCIEYEGKIYTRNDFYKV